MAAADRARSLVYVGMGAVCFFALAIAGWGVVSLIADTDLIAQPGYTVLPGAVGLAAAVAGWAGVLLPAALRGRSVGLGISVLAGAVAACAHLLVLTAAAALEQGADAALVSVHLLTAGYAAVLLGAGVLAAAITAVALRSGDHRAQWPWERESDDDA